MSKPVTKTIIWRRIEPIIWWLLFIGAALYLDAPGQFIITSLMAYILSKFFSYHRTSSNNSNWLYNNDKLNDTELAQKAIKDVSYAGLMYMASRENPATQSHITKITDLMNAHFETDTFPVMVTININEERRDQSTHGKIIEDIKVMLQHLPQEALTTINSIFHRFAFDADVTTPLIEQGYHDLMSVVEGK